MKIEFTEAKWNWTDANIQIANNSSKVVLIM